MADNGFKNYIVFFLLTGLFVVSIYGWAINLGVDYGLSANDFSTDKFNLTGLNKTLSKTSSNANTWATSFTKDNPSVVTGALIFVSLWDILQLMWDTITVIFTIMLNGISNVLGIPSVIGGVVSGILFIGLIFAGWRLFKVGE